MNRALILTVLLSACATGEGEIDQLENFEASLPGADDDWAAYTLVGEAGVEGSDKTWTVSIDGEALELHVAGASDLSILDGIELTAEVSERDWSENRTVAISDAEGLVFANALSSDESAIVDALGADFIEWGDEVGSTTDELYRWSYRYAVLHADDGEVEVLPGEATVVEVDGVSWRVVVHASYQVESHPDAALPCGGISDLLAFEVLRLESPEEGSLVTRPQDLEVAHAGCL